MAQDQDEYTIIITCPVNPESAVRLPLLAYLNGKGFAYATVHSGWGTSLLQQNRAKLTVTFVTAKNALSEAAATQIAIDMQVLMGGDGVVITIQKALVSKI